MYRVDYSPIYWTLVEPAENARQCTWFLPNPLILHHDLQLLMIQLTTHLKKKWFRGLSTGWIDRAWIGITQYHSSMKDNGRTYCQRWLCPLRRQWQLLLMWKQQKSQTFLKTTCERHQNVTRCWNDLVRDQQTADSNKLDTRRASAARGVIAFMEITLHVFRNSTNVNVCHLAFEQESNPSLRPPGPRRTGFTHDDDSPPLPSPVEAGREPRLH